MVLVSGSKNSNASGESVMLTARHSAKGYNKDIRLPVGGIKKIIY